MIRHETKAVDSDLCHKGAYGQGIPGGNIIFFIVTEQSVFQGRGAKVITVFKHRSRDWFAAKNGRIIR